MSKEIEEIKERDKQNYPFAERDIQMRLDIQILLPHISTLEQRVKELENRVMDKAKKIVDMKDIVKGVEIQIKELKEAINKHEQFKRTHDKVVSLEDEELYAAIK